MKQFYYELEITPNNHYDLYLDLILSITENAIEELDGTIIIRTEKSLDTIKEAILLFTKEVKENYDINIICDIKYNKKENKNWIDIYQKSIRPIEIGKFYIRPKWAKIKDDKIDILINPALAFGSGHHETTIGCFKAISKYVKKGDTLLDVGTGSGILAIASSKIGAICDMCDTDEVSIINAKENFELNNTQYNDVWIGSALGTIKQYDIVVANIVADVLIFIKNDLNKVLRNGGILIISGILDKYEDKILKKYKEFRIIEKNKQNEWITFIFNKDNNE